MRSSMKIAITFALGLLVTVASLAQSPAGCHVYVVDVSAVEAATKAKKDCPDESKCGVTTFPPFQPIMAEEELTTKSFPFPHKKGLFATGRVKFSDEMFLAASADSVYLSITLAPTVSDELLATTDSAAAEFNIVGPTAGMRVKRFYKVDGKEYIVGLQCYFTKLKI